MTTLIGTAGNRMVFSLASGRNVRIEQEDDRITVEFADLDILINAIAAALKVDKQRRPELLTAIQELNKVV